MKINTVLNEAPQRVAIIFGRFNPPHYGHKAAWETASKFDQWFVGTNKSTIGEKDPLPYEVKIEAMKAVWPEVADHIMTEQSWFTMASRIYERFGPVILIVVTDETDKDWIMPVMVKNNGVEGPHGYYNFPKIVWQKADRISSATDLRGAVANGDKAAFEKAAGVSADTPVAGSTFYEVVSKYLMPYLHAKAEKERIKAERDAAKAAKTKKESVTEMGGQGVAEGSLTEYGDTPKGQKMLTKVQKRAVDRVTSKKADTDPAYAKKNKDTADRAWERMTNVDEGVDNKKQLARVKELLAKLQELKDKGLTEAHPNSKIYDKCWDGYRKVHGKKRGEKGSCVKESFTPMQIALMEGGHSLYEDASTLNIGDPVIITGKGIEFEGTTGEIVDFGQDNKFVIVNLYNHGKHSFHSSDVSYNDYADSDEEEARMYDRGEFRDDFEESADKVAGRHDPEEFDDLVKRVGQRAKQGPMKTVWDPEKRVYKNVPVKQDTEEVDEASLATMRKYFAGDTDAKDQTKLAQMRDFFNKHRDDFSDGVQRKEFNSMASYQQWLERQGMKKISKDKPKG